MTVLEQYRTLTLPLPYRVLGQRLLPLTIGHMLILDRLDIWDVRSPENLILAVTVCSQPAEDYERFFTSWRAVLARLWTRKARRILSDPVQFEERARLFREYIEENTEWPEYTSSSDTGSDSIIPFAQSLRVTMISKLGYRPEDVNGTPYKQAVWDYLTYCEQEGGITISDVGDRYGEEIERMEALHRERMAKGAK